MLSSNFTISNFHEYFNGWARKKTLHALMYKYASSFEKYA